MTNKLSHITDRFIEICQEQKKLYAERDTIKNGSSGSEDFVQNSNALDKTFNQFKKIIPLFKEELLKIMPAEDAAQHMTQIRAAVRTGEIV
tara:strand:+ start:669 stop:941 length:273 start_codon:yes stop_codon:yes gene_type:complete